MGKGIQLAGGYGAGGAGDALVEILARKFAEKQYADQQEQQRLDRQRLASLDAEAAEERRLNRERVRAQDERQRRMDDETREGKLAKEGLDLATLFPGKVVSGDTLKRYPKFLHELIAAPKDERLASRSIGGGAVAGDPNAGDIDIEAHAAVGPNSYELQLPVSERMRLAAERATAAETKRASDERYRDEKLERDTQHKERMAAIAQQRVDRGGGAGGGGAASDDELDALATMIETNPDMLQRLNPTARTKVMARIATRGGGRMRNERADSMRNMVDTATDTVRRLRGDDAQGNKGRGGKGFGSAVGGKGMSSLFGLLEEPIAGTEAAGYTATVDALRSQLTLPELQKMKGMGALSDREFKTLAAGATTLSRALSEADFLAELDRIEETLAAVRSRMPDAALIDAGERVIVDDPRPRSGGAAKPTRDPSGGFNALIKRRMVRVQAPNGQIRDVPEDEVSMFTAAGGKVVK